MFDQYTGTPAFFKTQNHSNNLCFKTDQKVFFLNSGKATGNPKTCFTKKRGQFSEKRLN